MKGRAIAIGMLALLGCSASFGAPENFEEPPDEPPATVEPREAMVVPLRRLTRAQYEHVVRGLLPLPEALDLAGMLPVDDRAGPFAANATALSDTVLEQYERVAEAIAAAAASDRQRAHACLTEPIPTLACAEQVVDALGPAAFRRPLSTEEREELLVLVGAWETAEDATNGIRILVATLLQSPAFLYRVERGEPVAGDPGVVQLTAYELATRMSLLLWASAPDIALMAAAADGSLLQSEGRLVHFDRMMEDDRTRDGLARMHREWLDLDALSHIVKDRNVFPAFSEAIGPLLLDELVRFVDHAVREDDGTLATLLTSRRTIAGPGNLFWYGADATLEDEAAPDDAPEGARVVTLDPQRRAGVMTLLPVMAAHAKPDRSDPIGRGALVRVNLLCQPLGAVPPDVAMPPAAPLDGASLREQLLQHANDPTCAACHALIDPVGFALEAYDAMGASRTQDRAGNPIDTRGEVVGADIDGPVDGGVALAQALASSDVVARCYATQWFRYTVGRIEDERDAELLTAMRDDFVADGAHVPSLLRNLVGSQAFAHRRSP